MNAGRYTVGEAIDHGCFGNNPDPDHPKRLYSDSELLQMRAYIHTKRPNSVFVIDGYKRCEHLIVAGALVDKIMFSSYHHWIKIGGYCNTNMSWGPSTEGYNFINRDADQRPDWSDMKNLLGSKFTSTWINGIGDNNEFNLLFGHANNLGLKEIWTFVDDPDPWTELRNASLAAWYSGYLRRWDRLYRITMRCDSPDPCDCDPTDPDAGWYEVSITRTGSIREVIR